MNNTKSKMGLTKKIFIALIIGILVGVAFNLTGLVNQKFGDIIVNDVFGTIGSMFITAIKMMMVPVVLFSLIVGAASMGDISKLGRIGLKTIIFYLITTALAITLALCFGLLIKPGVGAEKFQVDESYEVAEQESMLDTLVNIIPSNPFRSLVEANMLQIIFFSILVGIAISMLGDKTEKLRVVLEQTNDVMLRVMLIIMKAAPIGVFALLAKTFSLEGFSAIVPLGKYFIGVIVVVLFQLFLVYPAMIKTITKLSPIQYFKNSSQAGLFAFSTSSSSATIPISLECMAKNQGVDRSISSFTIPLGATINMDGTSIMQGMAVIFIAQAMNVEITASMFITVIVMALLASIGTAGVPGAGLIMLAMVLTQVGLNPEYIGIIMGVDRLLDMTRTACNTMGDHACTLCIAKTENAIDESIFWSDVEPFDTSNLSTSASDK